MHIPPTLQKSVRESGERGRGDEKLQATISLSLKRLQSYCRVSISTIVQLLFEGPTFGLLMKIKTSKPVCMHGQNTRHRSFVKVKFVKCLLWAVRET